MLLILMNIFRLYSWNVLASKVHINSMTWKYCTKSHIELAQLDKYRYAHRSNIIMKIIHSWLSESKVIICLQEVPRLLLEQLLRLSIPVHYSKHDLFLKKDTHLVTIVKGFDDVHNEEIKVHDRSILRTNVNDISIINVHLYWKWNLQDIIQTSHIINRLVNQKFIICGDFNKTQDELFEFLNNIPCTIIFNQLKYTSLFSGKKVAIDHIIVSSTLEPHDHVKKHKKVLGHKIMYNIPRLCKLYGKNKLTLSSWINKRPLNDISDHLPISVKIKL